MMRFGAFDSDDELDEDTDEDDRGSGRYRPSAGVNRHYGLDDGDDDDDGLVGASKSSSEHKHDATDVKDDAWRTSSGRKSTSRFTTQETKARDRPRREGTRLFGDAKRDSRRVRDAPPPALWDGTRDKLGFTRGTREAVFADAESRDSDVHGTEYFCRCCRDWFPARKMQVDHIEDICRYVELHTDLVRYTYNGSVWLGVKLDEARQAANDLDNLQLICQPCNGSKNAEKGYSHSGPTLLKPF